jgi:hypothetical protein
VTGPQVKYMCIVHRMTKDSGSVKRNIHRREGGPSFSPVALGFTDNLLRILVIPSYTCSIYTLSVFTVIRRKKSWMGWGAFSFSEFRILYEKHTWSSFCVFCSVHLFSKKFHRRPIIPYGM